MELIDTHAHIYLPEFENDLPDVLGRASAAGVTNILMPAIDSSTHQRMLQLDKENVQCLSMIGLHPCSVNQNFAAELNEVQNLLRSNSFVAIGEIGLDFYWDKTFTAQQYDAFHQQIETAVENGLPIVIHSRNAVDECIAVVREHSGTTGVFHCFSGTLEQAQKIIDLGFYLGIGGVATFKNGGLDKVLPHVSLDRIVLETDAPYLAPVPFRGKRNEPSYLKIIAERVAALTGKNITDVAGATTFNAKNLFGLA